MYDRIPRGAVFGSLAFASILACSKSPETSPTTPPPSAEAPAASPESDTAAAPSAWSDEMSNADKAAFMKTHVVPTMMPVFQTADAEHYAEFGCKTCHGPKNQDPQEFLPHLTVKDGQLVEMTTHPEVSKFMGEQVLPKMVEVLGESPYDPATGQGFGCNGCHAIDMQ